MWLKKLRLLFRGDLFSLILTGEEIVGTFYEKRTPKTNQKEFRDKKVIKIKADKLYANMAFNSWIDKNKKSPK